MALQYDAKSRDARGTTEQRRREREHHAYAMQSFEQIPAAPEIAEHLEPAMAQLDTEDRDALVLRYLADRGLREVGAELGISEEAARKRVTRALERLRSVLEQRSVSISVVVLASVLTSSMLDVPGGLAATITRTVVAQGATASLATGTGLTAKTLFSTLAALAVVGAGTGLFFRISRHQRLFQYHVKIPHRPNSRIMLFCRSKPTRSRWQWSGSSMAPH